jgi:hypothetical protein
MIKIDEININVFNYSEVEGLQLGDHIAKKLQQRLLGYSNNLSVGKIDLQLEIDSKKSPVVLAETIVEQLLLKIAT